MIEYDRFLNWAKKHFPAKAIRESGECILLNSIFIDDHKHHLSCKPSFGCYNCFKSTRKGSLIDLVMLVQKCSYDKAVDELGGESDLRYWEEKVHSLFSSEPIEAIVLHAVELPPYTVAIQDLATNDSLRQLAEAYLTTRKLPINRLYVCKSGEYANRIVIPYYGPDGELIYWNARDLTGEALLRYKGPHGKPGIHKENVLWVSYWPSAGTKLYLTEGEFDAMSLCRCGLHGAACGGKEVSVKQLELLNPYKVCIAFDNDVSGKGALVKVGKKMLAASMQVSYVRPPRKYKDWNQMLCSHNKGLVKEYIFKNERPIVDNNDLDMIVLN